MLLYHGTVLAFAKSIFDNGIDINKNKKSELDFGKGLYVSDPETATVFAYKKVQEIQTWDDVPDEEFLIPALLPIEIDDGSFLTMDVLELKKKNLEWLRFVFNTRRYHTETSHDIIVGAIADGAIDQVMSRVEKMPDFIAKAIAYSHFLRRENEGHLQYVLKTQGAVNIAKPLKPYAITKGDD